jgi:hypothetical protein
MVESLCICRQLCLLLWLPFTKTCPIDLELGLKNSLTSDPIKTAKCLTKLSCQDKMRLLPSQTSSDFDLTFL